MEHIIREIIDIVRRIIQPPQPRPVPVPVRVRRAARPWCDREGWQEHPLEPNR